MNKNYLLMGILNITPDSFSDGGKNYFLSDALKNAETLISDGADYIDVGGESTRPGYSMIDSEEEIRRVVPVIEALKKEFDIKITLDTYKSDVASRGLDAGADIINDIWGLKWNYDSERMISPMARLVSEKKVPVIIMHNRNDRNYSSLLDDVISDLDESCRIAGNHGIKKENIILDPGIGFAKDTDENLAVIKNIDRICDMGYPVLLGVSRKSVIGNVLGLPADEREEGTIALNLYGYMKGCSIFRVHDVKGTKRALDMINAIESI